MSLLRMTLLRTTYLRTTFLLAAGVAIVTAQRQATAAGADKGGVDPGRWGYTVEVPRPPRTEKHGTQPQAPAVGYLWLPDNVKSVRGLLVAGKTLLEKRIVEDPQIRAALGDEGMGAVYFEPALDALFDYVHHGSGEALEKALADLAVKSGHPELRFAPMLTVGHSTGGIFCRNVAYWQPQRVIGVLHVMSGNLQDDVWDTSRTLAGVPFLAINGEFEEYGPAGGDLKAGLRSEYSLDPADKTRQNQTQWVIVRQQLLDRRRRNPDNLMGLIVHRGKGHTAWDDEMSALAARFIRSAAEARVPGGEPDGKAFVRCLAIKAGDGWLEDADIKDSRFPPAAYADYRGDKALAFWYLDRATAEAVWKYHQGKWDVPDPTAGQPPDKRFTPPPALRDEIDAPPGARPDTGPSPGGRG